ncbi:delta 8-(E)-sphingolipid desaturase [Trematosphaeria pertusa]|uniref:Delta 8-(E)-sphingolipid desaturase n=1 Tax=Trematosphaeria pertusa TaxID=390896 RepID=A0A6A6HTU0_9PLEO|nr:delta 8-(E)-sphingolipid desaturase [Trematosphaeria pertusa]KAF2241526.1 delta 8-(E)-sphingolipid desaturase [Trematosphaeria pertusa]
MSRHPIPAREIERLVADGQPIVIHEGYALDLGAWIDRHPGGRLAILHMVGSDATDQINIYHSPKALLMMKQHRLGPIHEPWTNLTPPIRSPEFQQKPAHEKGADVHTNGRRSRRSVDLGSAAAVLNKKLSTTATCTRRTSPTASVDPEKQPLIPASDSAADKKSARERYATALEHKEVVAGLLGNPSVDAETQRAIIMEYRALHEQIKAEGLYSCRYVEYLKESVRYTLLFATFLYLLYSKWYLTSAIVLGLFWQQIMFTAHDAGHRGITGNFVVDTLIGAFIADFCCGLSIGWWKSSHNVHHLITNMPEHDPDIQNVPLFSTSPTYMKSILSSFYNFQFVWDGVADFLIPYQRYTYYPVMALARFNLYALSWAHLMSPRAAQLGAAWWTRPVEIAFMACYWALFGYGLVWLTLPSWPIRIGFVLISHLATMILHVQITLSHWGMPTADLGPNESFPQRQLRTTMDVDCPAWLDFVHGGLQFQAVHHLFPRVPRHNLRRGQVLVRQFCERTQIKYQCYGFVKGNEIVLGRLEEVAKMVTTLVDCQRYMAETGESGLH